MRIPVAHRRETFMKDNLATPPGSRNPKLGRIRIYPIKSLPGVECSTIATTSRGVLANDRRFALVRQDGSFLNAKTDARLHRFRLQATPDLARIVITDGPRSTPFEFDPHAGTDSLADWFRRRLRTHVRIIACPLRGFPDDSHAPGPTVISTATLTTIASWYSDLSLEEVRSRFRANLEIEDVPSFWEDQLCAEKHQPMRLFRIGPVPFLGSNPCQRCLVPTRHPSSSAPLPHFAKIFRRQRQASLPEWAPRSQFNHYYRAGINTIIQPTAIQSIRIGDPVEFP